MSSDNLNSEQGINAMGVSEKKVILRMIATFKRNRDYTGLRRFLGTKMNLDVQETEEALANIDENSAYLLSLNK